MKTNLLTLYSLADEQQVIPEEEFAPVLEPCATPLLALSNFVQETNPEAERLHLQMNFLAQVIKHASDVEHLLDRYQARNNRNWIYFRELTATAKNFGKAAFILEELKRGSYPIRLFPDESNDFFQRAGEAARFFGKTIAENFAELRKEARRLNLTVPKEGHLGSYSLKLTHEIILPHTIEEASSSKIGLTARKIAHRFVKFTEDTQFLNEVIREEGKFLSAQIPANINEGKLRRLGTRLHNLVSWYDSYLFNHAIEGEIPELKVLHHIFSMQLNLSKIATIIAHYLERHLLLPSPIAGKLQKIVPPSELTKTAFYFSLYYLTRVFAAGKGLAEKILDRMVEEVTYKLSVPKGLGFHARPSTLVAKVVQHHSAEVKMLVDDQEFDAGSILELLSAGGYIVTKKLNRVRFRGEKRALDDLKILAECNYGETRQGKDTPLPEALSYLR